MFSENVSSHNSESERDCTTPSEFSDFETINDEEINRNIRINQYAQNVIDYSSQYGGDLSISYTACNLTGRPSKFPDYGDFPETFAMRTYGPWWDLAPSRSTEIMPQTMPEIVSQDYIVLQFEELVIPEEISIFETYNPGAIVQIWAFTILDNWICLWQHTPKRCPKFPRMFTPVLKKIHVPTNIIRIDFNHSKLDYFTEIDAIILAGLKYNSLKIPEFLSMSKRQSQKGPILRKLESVKFKPLIVENHENFLKHFLINDFESFIADYGMLDDATDNTQFTLKDLPYEILFKICSHLDLVSLFRVSRVCKKLNDVCADPLLYREINLKPYWHLVNSKLLSTLSKRCRLIQKLDISWCGLFTTLDEDDVKGFISKCGKNLTHLRLNSVKFLGAPTFECIAHHCEHIRELSIRNFSKPNIFTHSTMSKFKNLEKLDLFRSNIDPAILLMMLKNNPKLKHLNLGFSSSAIIMDDVAKHIARYNQNIVSIDMWKSHSLSSVGLTALANCPDLEEVDFGWCLREEATPGESIKALVTHCRQLKKLFLASIRGLTDRDLENIAKYCTNLEQLDLMGVMGISTDKCYEILCKCKRLKLIDLSFCDHLDEIQLRLWQQEFTAHIKRSFVPSDLGN